MRGKKYRLILTILTLLASVIMVSVPVEAQDEVRIYVEMPDGYIPGVAVGDMLMVEVWIDSPTGWYDTADGIVQWAISAQVDPTVLEPMGVTNPCASGYFIYDYVDTTLDPFGLEYSCSYAGAVVDKPAGLIKWISCGIMPDPPTGAGASGKLCTLGFKSLSETDYSPIDMYYDETADGYYWTTGNVEHIVDVVEDGHYNEWIAVHDVAVTGITLSTAEAYQGETVYAYVDVMNEGDFEETFSVTAYADLDNATIGDEISIGVESAILASGSSKDVTFRWDTTGVAEGNYTISAEVPAVTGETDIDDNNYTDGTVEVLTAVTLPPVASFTYTPDSPTVGENVTFDASASDDPDGTIEGYDWDFDDGSTGSGEVLNHTYAAAGTFNVTLTVTDNDGLTNSTSDQIIVLEHDIAVTNVNVSKTEVAVGESLSINVTVEDKGDFVETFDVIVYANTTTAGNQTVTDLAVGSSETLTFSWNTTGFTAGNYTVRAEASMIPGETNTTDNTLTYGEVCLILFEPPDASFTYSPVAPVVGENVTFDASASDDPDGTIEGYDWDFDDGSTGSGEVLNHTYVAAGTFNVTLTVTDNASLTDTYTTAITVASGQPEEVHDVALTDVTASPATVSVGSSVSVNVVVKNEGTETETFNVTAYYNNDAIGTQNVIDLAPDDTQTLTFTWDTSDVAPGGYSISAKVPPLPQETDTDDNIRVDGVVTVKAEETPAVDTQWYSLAGIVMVLAGIVMVLAGIVMVISLAIIIHLLKSRK